MRHSNILLAVLAVSFSLPSWAQDIQRSSHPQGMQVSGTAELRAHQDVGAAVAVGEKNVSTNSAAVIRSGTQIQGNTKVTAEQKNATATAVGRNNAARNEAGVIGGK